MVLGPPTHDNPDLDAPPDNHGKSEPPAPVAVTRQRSGAYRASVIVRRTILGAIVVAIGTMVLIYFTRPGPEDLSSPLRQASARAPKDMEAGTGVGKQDAPLTLVVFEDFQCPFCLKFSATEEPSLIDEYVRPGKLKIIHLNLIRLGDESTRAALGAMCAADQGAYWAYYYRLYLVEADAHQYPSEKTNVGRLTPDKLKSYATDAGLDRQRFDACLDGQQHADTLIADERQASASGINATPGFVLEGHSAWVGAPSSLADWRKLLDQALATGPSSSSK